MNRTLAVACALLVACAATACAQDGSGFTLALEPAVLFPMPGTPSSQNFSMGAQGSITMDYVPPALPFLLFGGSVDYGYAPSTYGTLNTLGVSAGIGLRLRILSTFSAIAYGRGGYLLGMLGSVMAPNPYARAGLDLTWYPWPTLRISLGGEYVHQFAATQAQYQGVAARLSAGFNFSQLNQRSRVEIQDIIINPIFPVFYKYYNDNKVGTAKIRNGEDGPIRNVKVSFYVKQYMDASKECAVIPEMKKGEVREVPLYALFTRSILSVLEPTKAQAEIGITYTYDESVRETSNADVASINHRNGMTWDDDRHVASFATVNDPAVMVLAKQAAGIARSSGFDVFDTSFRQAMGVFEELRLFGLRYVPDPNMPYSTSSQNQLSVDYLQFPIQTLQFKSGDCDDISILYNAMLEAGGVETAFITVPGHIFTAFAIGMPVDKARAFFVRPDDLIVKGDKAWVPVEITLVQEGFLRAWQIGAREWRDAVAAGSANFYPTHDAWKLFEPVAILGTEQSVELPKVDSLIERYTTAMNDFIDREIASRVEQAQNDIAAAKRDPKPLNKLGVLYARYSLYDKAAEAFRSSLRIVETAAAYVNLGNVQLLKNDFKSALASYQGALRLAPNDASVLLGLVRAAYELDDRTDAAKWLDQLSAVDEKTAEKLSYVKTGESSTSARGAEAGQEEMLWSE